MSKLTEQLENLKASIDNVKEEIKKIKLKRVDGCEVHARNGHP